MSRQPSRLKSHVQRSPSRNVVAVHSLPRTQTLNAGYLLSFAPWCDCALSVHSCLRNRRGTRRHNRRIRSLERRTPVRARLVFFGFVLTGVRVLAQFRRWATVGLGIQWRGAVYRPSGRRMGSPDGSAPVRQRSTTSSPVAQPTGWIERRFRIAVWFSCLWFAGFSRFPRSP
jgi:hypothetical protein